MKIVNNKKIILAITDDFKIRCSIEDNLKYLGFEVTAIIPEVTEKFKYKNFKEWAINFILKNLFKDKEYKKTLRQNFERESLLKKISKADYSLTIRADRFEDDFIHKLLKCSSKNYSYQWDGLKRYERIIKLIPNFTKFYVFDKTDLSQKNKTYPTTNFYFDCYPHLLENRNPKYDITFIGSYDSRIEKLIPICESLYNKGYKLNIFLFCPDEREPDSHPFLKHSRTPFSYYEYLEIITDTKCIMDLHHESIHNGLSFRSFEALGYNKKLLTTNLSVKDYDFYDPQNVFFLQKTNDLNKIDEFLNSDYKEINPIIKNKYSFSNWIKYILEIENHTPIEIP